MIPGYRRHPYGSARGRERIPVPAGSRFLERRARAFIATKEKAGKSTMRGGKIIAFLSAKGGCGATTIACHVAAEMRARAPVRSCWRIWICSPAWSAS